jgi:hypothetical protein
MENKSLKKALFNEREKVFNRHRGLFGIELGGDFAVICNSKFDLGIVHDKFLSILCKFI